MVLRCGDCGRDRRIRRPNNTLLVSKIVLHSQCYFCWPESLQEVCFDCLIPFTVVPAHSRGLCNVCARRDFYRNLPPDKLAAVRAEEMQRMRDRRSRALQTPPA
jgi:hypothetical protein